MPHIHTEPGQHDLTATAFIVRTDEDQPRILVHPHRKLEILLPVGGHVELNENPWGAIIHEMNEESGYDISQVSVLQPVDRINQMTGTKAHPVPLFLQTHDFKAGMGHYHTDVGFAFVTDEPPRSQPESGESIELIWLTRDELLARKDEMPADIVEIYLFCLDVALPNWERVSPDTFDV